MQQHTQTRLHPQIVTWAHWPPRRQDKVLWAGWGASSWVRVPLLHLHQCCCLYCRGVHTTVQYKSHVLWCSLFSPHRQSQYGMLCHTSHPTNHNSAYRKDQVLWVGWGASSWMQAPLRLAPLVAWPGWSLRSLMIFLAVVFWSFHCGRGSSCCFNQSRTWWATQVIVFGFFQVGLCFARWGPTWDLVILEHYPSSRTTGDKQDAHPFEGMFSQRQQNKGRVSDITQKHRRRRIRSFHFRICRWTI